MAKIYDHSVIYDGVLYRAGESVPVVEIAPVSDDSAEAMQDNAKDAETPQKPKTSRKKASKEKGGNE